MTYILGWKDRGNNAYLCADSVITTIARPPHRIDALTSFGEKHVAGPQEQVFEGALKIIHLGKLAIAAASEDFHFALSIIDAIGEQVANGMPPRQAFTSLVLSHCPLPAGQRVQFLAVFPEGGRTGATLLAFNVDDRQLITEIGANDCAHLGSVTPRHKQTTDYFIRYLLVRAELNPRQNLACALGSLQSIGARNYLLDRDHAGGSFCGLYCNNSGLHWQADTLYLISPGAHPFNPIPHLVLGMIRDNGFVVQSTFANTMRAFLHPPNLGRDVDSWNRRWVEELRQRWLVTLCDYVVLINVHWANVTVIEMLGNLASKYARMNFPFVPESDRPMWSLSDEVHRAIARPMPRDRRLEKEGGIPLQLSFFPYDVPAPFAH